MWTELGFWRTNGGDPTFHIHGVTGPDEYTTVVNNNLFTNVMARYNLEAAALVVERLKERRPVDFERLVHRLGVTDDEVAEWRRCAEGMTIPFDEGLGIHPQDDFFLDREVWDLSRTPDELRPLMLHYHPLVIYRFQVLKQADVVLAMFLQGDRFTPEEKRANFEYYDPITTGDSTLSAVVQAIIAAEVGYEDVAMDYFRQALYVDLADLHDNTVDGMHIASAGGVWSALVFGFAGMGDRRRRLRFDPRLPRDWPAMRFRIRWHGTRLLVELTQDAITFTMLERGKDPEISVNVRGEYYTITACRAAAVCPSTTRARGSAACSATARRSAASAPTAPGSPPASPSRWSSTRTRPPCPGWPDCRPEPARALLLSAGRPGRGSAGGSGSGWEAGTSSSSTVRERRRAVEHVLRAERVLREPLLAARAVLGVPLASPGLRLDQVRCGPARRFASPPSRLVVGPVGRDRVPGARRPGRPRRSRPR